LCPSYSWYLPVAFPLESQCSLFDCLRHHPLQVSHPIAIENRRCMFVTPFLFLPLWFCSSRPSSLSPLLPHTAQSVCHITPEVYVNCSRFSRRLPSLDSLLWISFAEYQSFCFLEVHSKAIIISCSHRSMHAVHPFSFKSMSFANAMLLILAPLIVTHLCL